MILRVTLGGNCSRWMEILMSRNLQVPTVGNTNTNGLSPFTISSQGLSAFNENPTINSMTDVIVVYEGISLQTDSTPSPGICELKWTILNVRGKGPDEGNWKIYSGSPIDGNFLATLRVMTLNSWTQ